MNARICADIAMKNCFRYIMAPAIAYFSRKIEMPHNDQFRYAACVVMPCSAFRPARAALNRLQLALLALCAPRKQRDHLLI
jgi:hypothetical protein